ncbi:DUF5626 family protein [Enterococcus saccharolyticus]|uniref:DUF5626 domain-containing protein n=1 Tax=Enterococcus saccharolyticus subsp. saccharolyticus ATCC 43076 TaxID=1139996 RepID=S0JRY1_9ENTE|nr:DUF5626 family protein [Enterococcus saccharolyticus]EOT29696.1 hypothetical protein OMQ_01009 [Enterococcus saccharolyticus subsp. saccharolyticus ATCC 43076]EOT80856.1 hypothetical protein I572_01388 [Enterococcus saccharolyticus subsp. saccharolyticus ATCC 43076]OJG89684.1 hypothetical protein RV16_GL002226 [Enterococcus saccharolyticus]
MKKLLLLFAFTTFTVFGVLSEVNAEELSVDLNSSYASTDIKNDEGEIIGQLVVSEEIPSTSFSTRSYIDQALSNKTFDVKFIGVTANFGYKVTVKNKKITNAYGAWSNGIIWSTDLGKPYFTSTTSGVKGKTSFGISDFSFNTTVRLKGNIVDNRLKTYLSFS